MHPKKTEKITSAPTDVKVNRAMDPVADMLGGSQTVAYRVEFAHLTGSVTAGLLLSQFWYWSNTPTARQRDGWFYMTMDEITAQTGMGREEQETARKRLRELGLLEEERRDVKGTLHFRLVKDRLYELLRMVAEFLSAVVPGGNRQNAGIPQTGKAANQNAGLSQSRMRELRGLVRGIVTNQNAGIPQSLLLETNSGEYLESSLETREDPPINPPEGEETGTNEEATNTDKTGNQGTHGGVETPGRPVPEGASGYAEVVWSSVLKILESQMLAGEITLPTWNGHIKQLQLLSLGPTDPAKPETDRTAVIGTPSLFTRDWVEKRHGERLTAAFEQAGYGRVELQFVVGGA